MTHANRKETPKLDDRDWLRHQYIEKGKSGDQIAAMHDDVSRTTVYRRLREHNIERRPAQGRAKSRVVDELDWRAKQIIDGELLGDGSLVVEENGVNARFAMTTKSPEYRDWLSDFFSELGYETYEYHRQDASYANGVRYELSTEVCKSLTEIYRRWYSNGTKIVPKDISLQPVVLRHWYVGDGQLREGRNPILHTQGFDEESLRRLQNALAYVGIDTSVQKRGKLYVLTDSTERFFEFIEDLPTGLRNYAYKWK